MTRRDVLQEASVGDRASGGGAVFDTEAALIREGLEGQVACPFCGAVGDGSHTICPKCTMENTAIARKATKLRIGPWYVLQNRNPAAPGMKWETLLAFVRKHRVKPQSIVRGPTTHQLWRFAAHVKGLSREFGVCYSCGGSVEREAHICPHCNRLQEAPANPDTLLETGEGEPRLPIYKEISPDQVQEHPPANPAAVISAEQLEAERQRREKEAAQLREQHEAVERERQAAAMEREAAQRERERFRHEQEAIAMERDAIVRDKSAMENDRGLLAREREAIRRDRETAAVAVQEATIAREAALREAAVVREAAHRDANLTRESLNAHHAALSQEAAEREAALAREVAVAREDAIREANAVRDAALAREAAAREAVAREIAAKEVAVRDALAARDAAQRQASETGESAVAEQEALLRQAAIERDAAIAREVAAAREAAIRDANSARDEALGREAVAKEQAVREIAAREAVSRELAAARELLKQREAEAVARAAQVAAAPIEQPALPTAPAAPIPEKSPAFDAGTNDASRPTFRHPLGSRPSPQNGPPGSARRSARDAFLSPKDLAAAFKLNVGANEGYDIAASHSETVPEPMPVAPNLFSLDDLPRPARVGAGRKMLIFGIMFLVVAGVAIAVLPDLRHKLLDSGDKPSENSKPVVPVQKTGANNEELPDISTDRASEPLPAATIPSTTLPAVTPVPQTRPAVSGNVPSAGSNEFPPPATPEMTAKAKVLYNEATEAAKRLDYAAAVKSLEELEKLPRSAWPIDSGAIEFQRDLYRRQSTK